MKDSKGHAIAIVGVGAILPDAPDARAFWANLVAGRSAIAEVPAGRWDPGLYYDDDPGAPDKTYSKIGGWVRDWDWSPLQWRLPVPPKAGEAIDDAQKWAVACTRAALLDYGWPGRPLDQERAAVILGNAMGGGEKHYQTARRIAFPEAARELAGAQRPAGTSVIEDRPAIRLAQKPGHLSPEHSEAYMVGGPLPGSPRPVATYASTGSGHDHTMATGDTASDPSPRPWPN